MSDRKGQKQEPKKLEPSFGNNSLKDALSKWKVDHKPTPPEPPKSRVVHYAAPPPPPLPPKKQQKLSENDDALFRAAMEDVRPVKRTKADPTPAFVQRTPQEINEEAEALAQLTELIATGEGMDLADTDEYIEGLANGADRGLLTPLRRGDFSTQAHLDLHGLLADAAKLELEKFIIESRRRGYRCVLVIHGRGLHSKDQEPVLKSKIGAWLSRGRLGKIVLAFTTARPADGGAGAVYVLLRK